MTRLRYSVSNSSLSALSPALRAIDRDLSDMLSSEDRGAVVLCVDELVSNAIKYGYASPRPSDSIDVEIEVGGDSVLTRIADRASPFDPFAEDFSPSSSSPIEDWPIGRLGIKLVREMSGECHYRLREGGGNEVSLVRRLGGSVG